MCCPICLWLRGGGLAPQLSHAFPNHRARVLPMGGGPPGRPRLYWRPWQREQERSPESVEAPDGQGGGGAGGALAEGTAVASSKGGAGPTWRRRSIPRPAGPGCLGADSAACLRIALWSWGLGVRTGGRSAPAQGTLWGALNGP